MNDTEVPEDDGQRNLEHIAAMAAAFTPYEVDVPSEAEVEAAVEPIAEAVAEEATAVVEDHPSGPLKDAPAKPKAAPRKAAAK